MKRRFLDGKLDVPPALTDVDERPVTFSQLNPDVAAKLRAEAAAEAAEIARTDPSEAAEYLRYLDEVLERPVLRLIDREQIEQYYIDNAPDDDDDKGGAS